MRSNNRTDRNANPSKYRDNDDQRDPLPADKRLEVKPDTKGEARGDAREEVGNNTRGTDASPSGPDGNDRTRRRPRRDSFDDDLSRS